MQKRKNNKNFGSINESTRKKKNGVSCVYISVVLSTVESVTRRVTNLIGPSCEEAAPQALLMSQKQLHSRVSWVRLLFLLLLVFFPGTDDDAGLSFFAGLVSPGYVHTSAGQ